MEPFPTYDSLQRCQEECLGILSSCVTEHHDSSDFVCQLNLVLFLGAVSLAIFTGVGVPCIFLACYLSDRCRFGRYRRRSSDLERQQLNPRSVMVSCSDEATGSVVRQDISRLPAPRNSTCGVRF